MSAPADTRAWLLVWACLLVLLATAAAQGPAGSSWSMGRGRLFVLDNSPAAPSVLALDLPSLNVSARLAMPGTSLQLGVSQDGDFLGVFRNRDNDQQFFTVVNTGLRPIVSVTNASTSVRAPTPLTPGEMGPMRRPTLAKSVLIVNGTDGIAGVEYGVTLVYHARWRKYVLYAESHGTIYTYRADSLHSRRQFQTLNTFRLPVGHYHVLPYGNLALAPHTGAHRAYIMDGRGKLVGNYSCGACHGAAEYEAPGKLTAVFGCNDSVLVVRGSEAAGTYLPTSSPRVGSFVKGTKGVFWSSNALQRFFWRTDVRNAVPTLTNVTHRGGLVRLLGLEEEAAFVAVHNDGNITLYDGDSGDVLSSLQLSANGFFNQTAPFVQYDRPHSTLYVSVPAAGVIHALELHLGEDHDHDGDGDQDHEGDYGAKLEFIRTVTVGGMPGAMTLAFLPLAEA